MVMLTANRVPIIFNQKTRGGDDSSQSIYYSQDIISRWLPASIEGFHGETNHCLAWGAHLSHQPVNLSAAMPLYAADDEAV